MIAFTSIYTERDKRHTLRRSAISTRSRTDARSPKRASSVGGKRTDGGTSMARGVSQERLRAAREVVSLLRRDPSFRESVAVNEAGDRPIVVATLDERMDDLLRRVVAAGPPPVTV